MLTNRKKHTAAILLDEVEDRDEYIKRAEKIAYLKAEGDMLFQYSLLVFVFTAIGILWIVMF